MPTRILQLQPQIVAQLAAGSGKTAAEIAAAIKADPEDVFHVLRHLAANDAAIKATAGENPDTEKFSLTK